ncbi:MAG: hypothetical protein MAG458_00057 [Nitrosopumilus sp.]|nr:hypothetical protein [Nitrosopumilus sp.]
MQSNNSVDELIHLANDANTTLTQNARKIVLDILHQGTTSNTSNLDKILSLGKYFGDETIKQIGTNKVHQITQNEQKSKELSDKVSQCISKINQMSYDSLIIVLEQYSIGGVESATNYIQTDTRIIKTKRITG